MEIPIILESTSKYRQALLTQLGIPFTLKTPLFDEDAFKSNSLEPKALAQFLSQKKAQSLAESNNCIIAGDQLVELEGKVLGKPKTFENAYKQLKSMIGKTHHLHTAITVIHRKVEVNLLHTTVLEMKNLTEQQITDYLKLDEPFDCAGSYKIEQNGKNLFNKIDCDDFSAIQGLPLIHLTRILKQFGYTIPHEKRTS